MSEAVPVIVASLSQVLPGSTKAFELNGKQLQERLKVVDGEIQSMKASWSTHPVLVFHDALNYWTDRYMLPVMPIVSAGSGHEVSAKSFVKLLKALKGKKVSAVVVERAEGTAVNLARELKSKVVTLDFAASGEVATYEAWILGFAKGWDSFAHNK
jgi:ABC-type Zn uptake system ZnuABC Zn-binding protein ZnuA